ncbi:DMT family transporter [Rhodovastum atsumiense]|uniref:DMT family transporter n=1 Tax=Rhodovastum atsumiense TaxID=504468 RepID=A0A5M6IR51_9PROT|nr:DMT family transporter [Rhodovastum atsumiense]KAA5610766.1 DMT family transporter [Rhodovastum atsumiense]CAH2604431.1 DMT family transporter [Rhodovastum atsumiense]
MDAAETRATDNPLRGVALIIGASLMFSLSDASAKFLSRSLPVVEIAWIRYVCFVAMAVILVARSDGRLQRPRSSVLQVLRGLGLVGSAIFFILGASRMPLADAAAVSFVSPMLITLLSIPILGEQVGIRRWAAVAVGLFGVLVVVRPGTTAFDPAALIVLASSACWATGSVLTRRMSQGERATTTLLWSALTGLVVLTALLPTGVKLPTLTELGIALFLGTVAAIGQYLMLLAYRHAAASLLAPFSYLQLIWSTALGWLVFAAFPDGWTLLGAVIIIGSGLYTVHRERVRMREARAK